MRHGDYDIAKQAWRTVGEPLGSSVGVGDGVGAGPGLGLGNEIDLR